MPDKALQAALPVKLIRGERAEDQGILPDEIGNLRKRQLIGSYVAPAGPLHRDGTYWSIRSNVADFRKHYNPKGSPKGTLPYPRAGV